MTLSVLLFIAGIVLLWAGTEFVLQRVPILAGWLRVSPLVVTVLLLAVMTSLPEFCVSLFASMRGHPDVCGRHLRPVETDHRRSDPS